VVKKWKMAIAHCVGLFVEVAGILTMMEIMNHGKMAFIDSAG